MFHLFGNNSLLLGYTGAVGEHKGPMCCVHTPSWLALFLYDYIFLV